MTAKKKPAGGIKPSQVLTVINEAGRDLNIDLLAEEMLDAFGGAKEFCRLLKTEYDSEGSTSIARSNILQSVVRVVTQAANKKSGTNDLGGHSTAELEAQLARLLTRVFIPTGEAHAAQA